VSQGEEPSAYVLDAETFGALRRAIARLRGDGPLVGDERRTLANRMNALLQNARPQLRRQTQGSPSEASKDSFWALKNQPFGKT
jgi:hypothetical protein